MLEGLAWRDAEKNSCSAADVWDKRRTAPSKHSWIDGLISTNHHRNSLMGIDSICHPADQGRHWRTCFGMDRVGRASVALAVWSRFGRPGGVLEQGLRDMVLVAATALLSVLCGCTANVPPAKAAQEASAEQPAKDVQAVAQESRGKEGEHDETRQLAASSDSKRYALVFGNGAYRHGDALVAPPRDAALMASALQSRGYHVLIGIDRDLDGMREDIAAFEAMSNDAELRLFYFAGHGFEFDNANYLMPVDLPANIADLGEQDVRNNALRLDRLVWELEQDVPVLVAVIDACRVPPVRGTATARGLGAEEAPEGTIVAYATAPGRVAMDSLRAYGVDEQHSPYTYYLANALLSSDVQRWDQAFQQVYSIVNDHTRGAQQPWTNSRVTASPAIGQLQASSAGAASGLLGIKISPQRLASGRYWANEAISALRLAGDRSNTDDELQQQAREGDARAAIALASRWSAQPGRKRAAIALLQPFAEQGNAVAQLDLGTELYALAGEDEDGHDARYWWSLAGAQGVGEARAKLAMLDGDATHGLEEFARGMLEQYEAFAPKPEKKR